MVPVIVRIGPVTIYSFGVLMALAFLVGGWIFKNELEKRLASPLRETQTDLASTIVLCAAVGGLVGARAFFIIEEWDEFVRNPSALIFTGAGFVWYGGLLGGLASVSWLIHRKGLPWLPLADAAAPALAVAYGIGRLGCHIAGDGDWGTVTNVPWAVAYPNAVVGWNYPPGVRVHPTPIYELLESFLIFGILRVLAKRDLSPGGLFWSYLILASVARFAVEFWRINPKILAGLTEAQIFAIFLFSIGTCLLLKFPQPSSPKQQKARVSKHR